MIMPIMAKSTPKRTVQSVINDLIGRVNTDTRRLRIIEQELNILKSRMAALEQNSSEQRKAINVSTTELGAKAARAEDKVSRMESLIGEVVKGMKRFAPTSEVKKLEQLIEIYSPLKSEFVTKEEAERMIEEALGKK